MNRGAMALVAVGLICLSSCGADDDVASSSVITTAPPPPNMTQPPDATEAVETTNPVTTAEAETSEAPTTPLVASTSPADSDGTAERFAVAGERELVILCEGEGSPTVVLEDGHPSETGGIARFSTGELWAQLTAETRVCAYDRAGYGGSDPAPNEPRDADDVVHDLQALLSAAGESGPFVLAGSSFGGMIVTYFAARDPSVVDGVVLLDVPAPTDTLTIEEIPELAWDHPANPEHVDVIQEFETRFARDPLPIEAPLIVLTATDGQSSVEDQSFWLELSPDAEQIELEGGHDIDQDDPAGVAQAILEMVAAAAES